MKLRRLLAALAALALFLAACGGDDDSAEDGTDDGAVEDAAGDDSSEEEDTGDDSSGDELPGGDIDIPAGVDLGECGFLVDFSQAISENGMTGAFGTSEGMSTFADAFAAAADSAPSEISGEFAAMSDYFAEVAQALAGFDIDFSDPSSLDPEVFGEYQEAMDGVDDSEFTEASENVSAWMEANCGEAFEGMPFG